MEVEVPVFGKMVVPEGTNPDELLGSLGAQYGVDINKQITPLQAFERGVERGVTGTTRGVGQVMTKTSGQERVAPGEDIQYDAAGNVISGGTTPSVQEQRTKESVADADIRKEFEYELGKLQGNKFSSYAGYILGTIADPANLIGGLGKATVRTMAAEGVIAGGVQGFFDPNYSDDTWSNRLISAAEGATGGGVIGGLLGKGMKKLGWIEKDAAKAGEKVADNITEDVGGTVNKAMDDIMNPPKDETKLADEAIPAATPETKALDEVPSTVNPEAYNATLPKDLQKSAPRYGRDVVSFASDLDRALYIVRDPLKRSTRDADFMSWIKEVTGISDDMTIRRLGNEVKQHVKDTKDLGVIPPSNLSLNVPAKSIDLPTAPFSGVSGKLDSGLNVDSNTWKSLDNVSQNLYNIGRKLLERDLTGMKAPISALEQKQAHDVMKAIDPSLKIDQMAEIFRGYAKAMDSLNKIKPDGWEAPSLGSFLKKGISHEDLTDLTAAGVFDGCPL